MAAHETVNCSKEGPKKLTIDLVATGDNGDDLTLLHDAFMQSQTRLSIYLSEEINKLKT
jgi:hypothetical protein